jgi:hypothetical protein
MFQKAQTRIADGRVRPRGLARPLAVHYCTQPALALTYARGMQLKYKKLISIGIWLVTMAILGMSANLTSTSSRIVMAAVGLIPAILILRFWNGPAKTMSERINDARG